MAVNSNERILVSSSNQVNPIEDELNKIFGNKQGKSLKEHIREHQHKTITVGDLSSLSESLRREGENSHKESDKLKKEATNIAEIIARAGLIAEGNALICMANSINKLLKCKLKDY